MKGNPFENQLERLARTLTEQFGVKVLYQGNDAWTDGQQIVLPSVPEPLTRGGTPSVRPTACGHCPPRVSRADPRPGGPTGPAARTVRQIRHSGSPQDTPGVCPFRARSAPLHDGKHRG
jgi:hypothetical protein